MASSDTPVFTSPSDDKEMEAAAAQARRTFRFFWRELHWEHHRIVPGLQLAAVKASFSDPPGAKPKVEGGPECEHMWLVDIDFDGREVTGTLINTPSWLSSVSAGEEVRISGKHVFDWMYVQGGEVYGGFTVDLLRSRMSKSERKQHDKAWGFDFGEVGDVKLVPPNYIGEEAPKKGGLLSRFGSAPKAEPQDYARVAETEHPMSVNMRESLEQQLDKSPELAETLDDRGYNLLQRMSLAGSWDSVDACLNRGMDPSAAAANKMTPVLLAKSLGWKRVLERLAKAGAA